MEEEHPEIELDRAKARFEGELLGIYFALPEALEAKGIVADVRKVCSSGFDVVPDHPAIPPAPPYLPAGAKLPPVYPAVADEPNPGANICRDNGQPYTAWRYYEFPPLPNGLVGSILISRQFLARPYYPIDAPKDRIEVTTFGERKAVTVKPIVPEGGTVASITSIIFPQPGGFAVIQTDAIPFEEVTKVAEALSGRLQ